MEELILFGLRCESKKSVKVKHACNVLDNIWSMNSKAKKEKNCTKSKSFKTTIYFEILLSLQ